MQKGMERLKGKLAYLAGSIGTRIIVILVCLLLPVNLLMIWLTRDSMQVVQRQEQIANENVLNIHMTMLEKELDGFSQYMLDLLTNSTELLRFANDGQDYATLAMVNLWEGFRTRLSYSGYRSGLFVAKPAEGTMALAYDALQTSAENLALRAFVTEQAGKLGENPGWGMYEIGGQEYLVRAFSQQGVTLGALLPVADIEQTSLNAFEYAEARIALLRGGQPAAEKGQTVATAPSQTTGFTLSLVVDNSEMLQSLPVIQRFNYGLSFVLLLLIPILYLLLRRILLQPLYRIDRALHRIEGGDLEYRIGKHRGAKEFVWINAAFNSMADQIRNHKIQSYEKELARQRQELKSLQLQIRPHFLFNTFNLIHSMAELKDFKGVQRMMLYMTDYFRYSIRTGFEMVPLQKEIDFLQLYCNIAAERYPGCFEFVLEVEPGLERLQLPPLLVHTFVENSFKHTVRMGSFVNIGFSARRQGNAAVLCVYDDGEGMTDETLREIQQRQLVSDEFGAEHIGLWNCYKRLEIIYGSSAEVLIDSRLAEGTRITVTLPYQEEAYDTADL